jgi:hypothetical protein
MSYEIEFIEENDYLHAIIKGFRNSDSIKHATRDICENCIKNKCTKALVDVRDIKEHIDVSEIFDLASFQLPEIIKRSINKVAILESEGNNIYIENSKFFENVATNRGHNVKIFSDISDAKKWLK